MNTIKRYLGLEQVVIIKFLLIFNLLCIFSNCSKRDVEPNTYNVNIENTYFENISSVKLGDYTIENIKQKESSSRYIMKKGMYDFFCITQSKLKIMAMVDIRGLNSLITIKVTNKGQVTLVSR